ncbi:MAG TPA: ABC transporter substrate-binding protein [Burkholderiaceae bacterium]|nr:ABC transporter substrate-binding protein [Burkholderiaceae bacterium]
MKSAPFFKRLVAASAIAVATGAAFAQDIKIGFNGDLSASPSAMSGQAGVLGIEAAIADINAAGGVLGRKFALVVRDDQSQPPKSIQNMTDLIDNEKVIAVFGPTNSGNALAWKHIPNQKKVPVIGMIGSATDITKPASASADNYMFRVSMVDREQIAGLVAYVKKNPASKKVGFMAETTGYGQGGLKDIQEIAELHGIKPVAVEKFGVADTDMTSQLNKMKTAGVDTIIVWAQGTPTGQLMRSMEKINYFPLTLSSWAADNASFYDAAGKTLAEKPIFMRTVTETRPPRQQKLYDRVAPNMKSPSAFGFAAHGYDAVQLLALAIKQAGTTEGAKVREALENLQTPYEGVMKTYKSPFAKSSREALTSVDYQWTRWKDGKLVAYTDDVVKSLTAADFKR